MTEQTVTTTAVGRASAPPDQVDLAFVANAVEPAVADARRSVAEQAARLREALEETGVPDDRIRTERFRVRQQSPDPEDRTEQESRPYRATEHVGVTLLDLDRLGESLSAAVDRAGVEVGEVAFTFRPETRRELQREAIADAVETTRRKAEAAAAAENVVLDGVRSIVTDDGSKPRRTGSGRLADLSATQQSGSVESGPIDVEVRVEVAYGLGEPE